MTDHHHAIVWIDHREAKIFHVDVNEVERLVVASHLTGRQLQHKANTTGSGRQGVDKEFFERVVAALVHTGAILLTGPANAKSELNNYIAEHRPDLAERVRGVEALDHPSDAQIVAIARKFFKADDRMQAQIQ